MTVSPQVQTERAAQSSLELDKITETNRELMQRAQSRLILGTRLKDLTLMYSHLIEHKVIPDTRGIAKQLEDYMPDDAEHEVANMFEFVQLLVNQDQLSPIHIAEDTLSHLHQRKSEYDRYVSKFVALKNDVSCL